MLHKFLGFILISFISKLMCKSIFIVSILQCYDMSQQIEQLHIFVANNFLLISLRSKKNTFMSMDSGINYSRQNYHI